MCTMVDVTKPENGDETIDVDADDTSNGEKGALADEMKEVKDPPLANEAVEKDVDQKGWRSQMATVIFIILTVVAITWVAISINLDSKDQERNGVNTQEKVLSKDKGNVEVSSESYRMMKEEGEKVAPLQKENEKLQKENEELREKNRELESWRKQMLAKADVDDSKANSAGGLSKDEDPEPIRVADPKPTPKTTEVATASKETPIEGKIKQDLAKDEQILKGIPKTVAKANLAEAVAVAQEKPKESAPATSVLSDADRALIAKAREELNNLPPDAKRRIQDLETGLGDVQSKVAVIEGQVTDNAAGVEGNSKEIGSLKAEISKQRDDLLAKIGQNTAVLGKLTGDPTVIGLEKLQAKQQTSEGVRFLTNDDKGHQVLDAKKSQIDKDEKGFFLIDGPNKGRRGHPSVDYFGAAEVELIGEARIDGRMVQTFESGRRYPVHRVFSAGLHSGFHYVVLLNDNGREYAAGRFHGRCRYIRP